MPKRITLLFDLVQPEEKSGGLLKIISPEDVCNQLHGIDAQNTVTWLTENGWRIHPAPTPIIFGHLHVIWYRE